MRSGFCRITATKPTLDSQVSNVATWCLRKLQNTKVKLHEIQVKLHEIWLKKQVSTAFSIDLEYNYHNRILFRHFQWLQPVKCSTRSHPFSNGFKTPWWRLWTSCWPMELQDISAKTKRGGHYPQDLQREISKWNAKMQIEDVGRWSRAVFETTSECNFVSWLPWIPICFRHVIYIDIYIYTSILWSHHQLAILKPIRATGWIENWRIELTKKKLQKWVSSSIDLYIC